MADGERFLARSAVFIVLRNAQGEVLLQRRYQTGYMDGRYDLPSGHVERGEKLLDAAVRELQEEVKVTVRPEDLQLWHVNQFSAMNQDYYNFFFVVDTWQGEPQIGEPEKCDDVRFFALDDLPAMTPGTHMALEHIHAEPVSFGFIDQAEYDRIVSLTK